MALGVMLKRDSLLLGSSGIIGLRVYVIKVVGKVMEAIVPMFFV